MPGLLLLLGCLGAGSSHAQVEKAAVLELPEPGGAAKPGLEQQTDMEFLDMLEFIGEFGGESAGFSKLEAAVAEVLVTVPQVSESAATHPNARAEGQ